MNWPVPGYLVVQCITLNVVFIARLTVNTIARIFMEVFRTGSPAIVKEYRLNFNFVLVQSLINN